MYLVEGSAFSMRISTVLWVPVWTDTRGIPPDLIISINGDLGISINLHLQLWRSMLGLVVAHVDIIRYTLASRTAVVTFPVSSPSI